METICKTRSVDGLYSRRSAEVAGGRDRNAGNRHREGLDGKGPDVTFESGKVGGAIDFIDAPVVGLTEIERPLRIIGIDALVGTHEYTQRLIGAGIIDVIKNRVKEDRMGIGKFARGPAQNDIAGNVNGFVFRRRSRGSVKGKPR